MHASSSDILAAAAQTVDCSSDPMTARVRWYPNESWYVPWCYFVPHKPSSPTVINVMQLPTDAGMIRAFKRQFITNEKLFDGIMITDSVTDLGNDSNSDESTGKPEGLMLCDGIARILDNIRTLTGYKVLLIQTLGARLENNTFPDISKIMDIFPCVPECLPRIYYPLSFL